MDKLKRVQWHLIVVIFITLNCTRFISCDVCRVQATCNCVISNHSINPENTFLSTESTPVNTNLSILQITDDITNICDIKNVTSKVVSKYVLNCTHVDITNSSTNLPAPDKKDNAFTLILNYACDAPKPPNHPPHGYSTGSILVIIFFTILFSYFGLGMCVNFFLIGARGIEMLPHLDFWKDFPALVLDGAKFLGNGCNARPSYLTSTTGSEGYDAI